MIERGRQRERGGGEGERDKYSVNMLCLSLSYYTCFINLLIFYIGIFIICLFTSVTKLNYKFFVLGGFFVCHAIATHVDTLLV